jgi:hypothetical protein
MKKLLLIALFLLAFSASAAEIVTATVTVTNTASITNNATITVNGITRTWKASVSDSATQIATNSVIASAVDNLFLQFAANPFTGLSLSRSSTNGIVIKTAPGVPLSVTLSDGYGSVSLSTNQVVSAVALRLPHTVEAAPQQTNVVSALVAAVGSDSSTNSINEAAPSVSRLVGLTNNQTVSGIKQLTNAANKFVGNFSGSVSGLLAFDDNPLGPDYGVGFAYSGTNDPSVVFTYPPGWFQSIRVASTFGLGTSNTSAVISSPDDLSIQIQGPLVLYDSALNGDVSGATNANASTLLGSGHIPSQFITNANAITLSGTNNVTGDLAFPRYAVSSLANGNNAAVAVGTNVFIDVSGPTGAFTINGINASPNRDGKLIILVNRTGNNMTIAHDSGVDPTASNRIVTMTGADRATTVDGSAMLIYNASISRWVLIFLEP